MSDYNKNIFDELREISPALAEIPRQNPFTVPDGYFERLTLELSKNILLRNNSQPVPSGYFETLTDVIMQEIRESSGADIKSLEQKVSGQLHTQVPSNYFDTLPEQILAKVKQEANLSRPMSGRVFFLQYAIAAALSGLLGFSLFSLMNEDPSRTEMHNILAEANRIIENESLEETFDSLDETEIVSFLEDKGHDVETALLATAAFQSELPEEFEYLSNENTLDEFLKKMKIPSSVN